MNEIQKAQKVYCDAKASGKSNAEATKLAKAVTEIGHTKLDLAWYVDDRNHTASRTPILNIAPADRPKAAVMLRAGEGWDGEFVGQKLSWGRLAIATGHADVANGKVHEGRCRSEFGREAGIASEGTRIGRGGRWLNNDQRLYTQNHKGVGVEDSRPRQLDPAEVMAGAADYTSRLPKIAKAKKAAAKRAAKRAATKARKIKG